LASKTLALLPQFNRTARSLNDRFLDIVRGHRDTERGHRDTVQARE